MLTVICPRESKGSPICTTGETLFNLALNNFYAALNLVSYMTLQEAQLLLTNHATLFSKVVEVLQDFLSKNVDKKFTTDYNVA